MASSVDKNARPFPFVLIFGIMTSVFLLCCECCLIYAKSSKETAEKEMLAKKEKEKAEEKVVQEKQTNYKKHVAEAAKLYLSDFSGAYSELQKAENIFEELESENSRQKFLKELAQKKIRNHAELLGGLYYSGSGVTKDISKAIAYFQKSNSAVSEYALGMIYYFDTEAQASSAIRVEQTKEHLTRALSKKQEGLSDYYSTRAGIVLSEIKIMESNESSGILEGITSLCRLCPESS